MGTVGIPDSFHGNVRPSSVEQASFESSLWAQRITEIPSNMQVRLDYAGREDGQPVYQGFAPRGLATNQTGWLIYKFTYDDSNNMTLRQVAYDKWDNCATTAEYA